MSGGAVHYRMTYNYSKSITFCCDLQILELLVCSTSAEKLYYTILASSCTPLKICHSHYQEMKLSYWYHNIIIIIAIIHYSTCT